MGTLLEKAKDAVRKLWEELPPDVAREALEEITSDIEGYVMALDEESDEE